MSSRAYRQLPNVYQPVGFELSTPVDVEVTTSGALRCSERQGDRTIGQLEVEVFSAALIIDRDGILEDKVRSVAEDEHGRVLAPLPVSLRGASGYRVEVERARGVPALPYVYVFAVAPLGIDAGVLVTVRCAAPEWAAADAILRSLKILTRRGVANDDDETPPSLPVIGRRG
jgi:hypothetical protein